MFYLVLFIDIDIYCLVYIFTFPCIQCNFIYILNIRVLADCTSCLDNFDSMSA